MSIDSGSDSRDMVVVLVVSVMSVPNQWHEIKNPKFGYSSTKTIN